MKSKVYFTKTITPEKVLEMYEVLGKELKGKTSFRGRRKSKLFKT